MTDAEFEPPEEPELLSLGLVVGGITPTNELVREAFIRIMTYVGDLCGRYSNSGLRVNIVFKIPGPMESPNFEGVYPARFARKTNHLLVNAAVPASLTFDHVPDFFAQALIETKSAALEYLRRRKIDVDTSDVMSLIDALVSERTAI